MNSRRGNLVLSAFTLATVLGFFLWLRPDPVLPIRIGVLHSLSGTMAVSERSLVDAVLNTVNGDSNTHFFRALHAAGLGAIPVVSFSVAEDGLQAIGAEASHPNHYAVWSYFQSIPGEANRRFVGAFQQRYGSDRVTSDPIEAAYVGVRLWAQAVRDAGTADPEQVNRAMQQQNMAARSGIAAVDRGTRHLWKQVRIGKARVDGQFDLLWSSGDALRPDPYPDYRSRFEWARLVTELSAATP